MLAIYEKQSIKLSPWLWITIQQDTSLPGSTKRSVRKCQTTCIFFLHEDCQAHAWLITKETEIRRWESSTETILFTIADFNSLNWKQEQLAYLTSIKKVLLCARAGTQCVLSVCSLSPSEYPAYSKRVVWGGGMCVKRITNSVSNNTFSVSENVPHRLPIGEQFLVLNKHAHTLYLTQTSLIIIYRTGAKEPAFLICSPVDSGAHSSFRIMAPGTSDLRCSVNFVLLCDASRE